MMHGVLEGSVATDQVLVVPANLAFAERSKRYARCENFSERWFPVLADQVGIWEWQPFFFEEDTFGNDVGPVVEQAGFEMSRIGHLLAFGERCLEGEYGSLVISPGYITELGFRRSVPALHRNKDCWEMCPWWWSNGYYPLPTRYCVLGVRRVPCNPDRLSELMV